VTDESIRFLCYLNPITFMEFGEVGYYLKLEHLQDKKQAMTTRKENHRDKVKQPLFQFRFDIEQGKFVRELRGQGQPDARQDPSYLSGNWVDVMNRQQ